MFKESVFIFLSNHTCNLYRRKKNRAIENRYSFNVERGIILYRYSVGILLMLNNLRTRSHFISTDFVIIDLTCIFCQNKLVWLHTSAKELLFYKPYIQIIPQQEASSISFNFTINTVGECFYNTINLLQKKPNIICICLVVLSYCSL